MDSIILNQDRYQTLEGVDLLNIVEQFDSPLYIYDAAIIKRQVDRMRNAFEVADLRINYACKALSNINILRYFKQLGTGLDTVSIQEVALGLQAGFDPKDILFTPNCVSLAELEAAQRRGVRINIDNLELLEQFNHLYPDTPVCIRLNPHIMAGGNSKISVGHIDSKFGISIHQLPHLLRIVETNKIQVEGLHMHTGSDILDADVFLRATEILLNAAMEFKELDYIDFGSGFKVAYKNDGIETDMEEFGQKISARFNRFCETYGRTLGLVFEPGKYLVSQAGLFVVRVNVVKTTPSTLFAGVDSGLNHLIRPMFYGAHHEISNLSNPAGKPRIYSVVGYICETDTFAANRKIPEVREGDMLCFHNAGAYCFTMASNYNSRFRPAEVLILDGQAHLIRARETIEDLLRNQIQLDIFNESSTHV